ncbi:MAG: type II toxin-antitoxin system RelE/ParE family toxin [Prolixibacteraceae bacterium]|nr:type II toxin-antitoxin system RelE/ParE family toxin [Prolixibacteraceae bacterium]
MKNTYKLIWSDEALNNLNGIIKYLENRWSQKEIKRFAQLLDKQLNLIKSNHTIAQNILLRSPLSWYNLQGNC